MATVWKFPLTLEHKQLVEMPAGAEPLSVAIQERTLTLWARVDPSMHNEYRSVFICGTGHPCPSVEEASHVGSVFDGPFVWHVLVAS